MDKVGTPECQLFISAYYAQKMIDTLAEDWILEKKYKNFHGFTCRDFYNEKLNIRSVVVAESAGDKYQLSVIENASYQLFLEEMAKRPLFYYVPVITNDGLVFYFEKTMRFDATGQLDKENHKQHPYLLKKLQQIFKKNEFATLGVGMLVAFPRHELEEIILLLEKNNLSFNPKLFDLLDKELYQPFMPDIALSVYEFPEYNNIDQEQCIDIIFSLASQHRELTNEEYARIKKLLKKLPLEEIPSMENIMKSLRVKKDFKLEALIEADMNRKKNQLLWKKLSEK